jgi:uncharacterized membrane protein
LFYKLKKNYLIFFLILLFGAIIRFYHIGNDDLWYDEILSFSLASDQISLNESHYLSKQLDGTPFLFTLILKFFFKIVSYNVFNGKVLFSLISTLSIASTSYIAFIIKNDKSFIFAAFLCAMNVFLISYSSEFRIYTFVYFFSSMSIIFFLRLLKENNKINLIFFSLFTILNSFLHPFSLIIFISYIIFIVIISLRKKISLININFSLLTIFSLILIYYIYYFYSSENIKGESWIPNVDLHFFYHYFFANFFGSRIMGIIFLGSIIFLIYKNLPSLKIDNYMYLLILILTAYILPLAYNYIFQPILIPRYIIFVLIPIIVIISCYSFNLKKNNYKYFFIFIITASVLINFFGEESFKKIVNKNFVDKPQFTKLVDIIGNSNYKNFTIKFSHKSLEQKKNEVLRIYEIYLNYLNKKNNLNTNYIKNLQELSTENSKEKKIWIICDPIINEFDCSIEIDSKYKVIKNIDLYKLNLKLVEKI